ncbi:hypothetical protein EYF80_041553 [Liparis tanakae]|uniref:Uncharacterized protein n=1 Tax=Liparis tanakae TaxID=230148 RepID=A0A4Z2G402_9TELE|nr:hypothetical protein EYF80_041553 [Liparis tanakae]
MPLPGVQDTRTVLVSQSRVLCSPLWGHGAGQERRHTVYDVAPRAESHMTPVIPRFRERRFAAARVRVADHAEGVALPARQLVEGAVGAAGPAGGGGSSAVHGRHHVGLIRARVLPVGSLDGAAVDRRRGDHDAVVEATLEVRDDAVCGRGLAGRTGAVAADGDGGVGADVDGARSPLDREGVDVAVQLCYHVVGQTLSCGKRMHLVNRFGFKISKTQPETSCTRHSPESKVMGAPALLLHVALVATTTAEYRRPQSSRSEQVVALDQQEATWPWPPVTVAV